MYKIMNKDLDAYSMQGFDCPEYYDRDKDAHLNKNDTRYGDVLVKTKRVKIGFGIKVKIFYRKHWYWKPYFSWKYNKYLHWLFFMIWYENEYDDVIDKVQKDHLTEFLNCS